MCSNCNIIAPSHARTPPIEPCIPTTPFEAIACDYFHYMGWYYFVAADRLSGWTEQQRIKVGTNEAGSQGLCKALRRIFVTFCVPVEISSDGGPEFISKETKDFFRTWGVRHRLSSVDFPSSNGRAELAVKATKCLLMSNVGPNGSLNNDKMVRSLLTHRNTPDPGCKLSPAQILFGRPLRDTLPYIKKHVMAFNNLQIHDQWRKTWGLKEEAMKARYMKSLENLNEHAQPLPPLRHGDHVLLQNQSGRYPKKWDRSGVIVEVKENDQYVAKVAGTGRMTLRNRRFLRKYEPHFQQGPLWRFDHPTREPNSTVLPPTSLTQNDRSDTPRSPAFTETQAGVPNNVDVPVDVLPESSPSETRTNNVAVPGDISPESHPSHNLSPQSIPMSSKSASPKAPSFVLADDTGVHLEGIRRSTRARKKSKFYDPSTGKYTEQNL